MTAVTWTKELSVGVDAIDTDHKLILSLINQLHDAMEAGEGRTTVNSVLNALLDYTEYHFGREEALMAACEYPDLDQHRKVHKDLKSKIVHIRDTYVEDPSSIQDQEVLDFLKNWLTEHIKDRDKSYQPHMDQHQAEVEKANDAFSDSLSV